MVMVLLRHEVGGVVWMRTSTTTGERYIMMGLCSHKVFTGLHS